jgi:hypothetical protein
MEHRPHLPDVDPICPGPTPAGLEGLTAGAGPESCHTPACGAGAAEIWSPPAPGAAMFWPPASIAGAGGEGPEETAIVGED